MPNMALKSVTLTVEIGPANWIASNECQKRLPEEIARSMGLREES
jgi:hypothetical protein